MRQARSIDEVVSIMDDLIDDARRKRSRVGYFTAMYRAVTVEVARGIREGRYDDGERMNRFDTAFANLFFAALEAYEKGERLPKAWRVAFAAAEERGLLVVQHLLLGMNAHINHDLGIAAADVAPGAELQALRDDFERINDLLEDLVDTMQDAIGDLSPCFRALDVIGLDADEAIVNFSIRNARKEAWDVAELLAHLDPAARPAALRYIDKRVHSLAELIRAPGGQVRYAIKLVTHLESDDVPKIIDRLYAIKHDPNAN